MTPLVELLNSRDGVFGARQVGAGFGGCVLALVSAEAVETTAADVARDWSQHIGRPAWVHRVRPAEPTAEVGARALAASDGEGAF